MDIDEGSYEASYRSHGSSHQFPFNSRPSSARKQRESGVVEVDDEPGASLLAGLGAAVLAPAAFVGEAAAPSGEEAAALRGAPAPAPAAAGDEDLASRIGSLEANLLAPQPVVSLLPADAVTQTMAQVLHALRGVERLIEAEAAAVDDKIEAALKKKSFQDLKAGSARASTVNALDKAIVGARAGVVPEKAEAIERSATTSTRAASRATTTATSPTSTAARPRRRRSSPRCRTRPRASSSSSRGPATARTTRTPAPRRPACPTATATPSSRPRPTPRRRPPGRPRRAAAARPRRDDAPARVGATALYGRAAEQGGGGGNRQAAARGEVARPRSVGSSCEGRRRSPDPRGARRFA